MIQVTTDRRVDLIEIWTMGELPSAAAAALNARSFGPMEGEINSQAVAVMLREGSPA